MMSPLANRIENWKLPDMVAAPQVTRYGFSQFNHYIDTKMRGYRLNLCGTRDDIRFFHGEATLDYLSIDLVRLDTHRGFVIRKYDCDNIYTLQFPIDGQCEVKAAGREMSLRPGQYFIANPSQLLHKRWESSMLQLMLRIKRSELERILSEELGVDLRTPLEFSETVGDGTISSEFPCLVEAVWRDYHTDRLFQHHRIRSHLERAILLAVLSGTQHNHRSQFDNITHAAPYYVKRAEEFIHEHIGTDVTTLNLVEAAGVSERSLYYGFKRWRNTTPMAYLRRIRLDRARQDLLKARRNGRSITDVAMNLGYTHLSRFSKDYKARFGETPSETLLNDVPG